LGRAPIDGRAKIISHAAQLLLERKSELAKLATLEMGKRIAESRGEVELSAAILQYFADLDDADLDHTVAMAILGRFGNNGQTCIGAKRFIVVESMLGKFFPRFIAAAKELKLGDPVNRTSVHEGRTPNALQ
jgi:acyl-CoA reductase-like NAD-dependent aldehyde dehydrogenase